ncbi:MAG: MFS transporter [Oscillospiraceae bacterium]|nr:MFS transporter [Oscillospiraceae bacterium]
MKQNFKRTKFACYAAYFTMSSIFCVPPLLYVTFHEAYGISFTLLGTLVVANFLTQLGIDLIFSAFSRYFPISKIVKIMPILTCFGMVLYALIPWIFPDKAYWGLIVGTVIFSVSAGFSEVLLSPSIAAIPSKNPQRDMSTLHSLYAFGVLAMVSISSVFLKIFGTENWMYLVLILAALPLIPAVLFMISPMPDFSGSENTASVSKSKQRTTGLLLCLACIFLGSCAENTMSNWLSGFMETSLGISKEIGDILGVAGFAVLLGIMRIGYARFGKNIGRVLLIGMIGAAACYLVAGLSRHTAPAFIACILTGLFTSMLWPGTLILMEENIPNAGVAAFALMAAGGDLGASLSPQLLGAVTDAVAASNFAIASGNPEQIGMKAGMLATSIFPILGIFAVIFAISYFKKGISPAQSYNR